MNISKFSLSLGLAALVMAVALPAHSQAPAAASDEAQSYKAIQEMYTNSATTPDQMDKSAKDFIAKYPNSVGLIGVETMAMDYYARVKRDYPNTLVWGEMALQKDPGNFTVLSTLAAQIPTRWHDTDLDGDQRLAEAGGYDQKLIDMFDNAKAAPDGSYTIDGHKVPAADFTQAKAAFEGTAYSSMGRIAFDQKKYQDAVDNYKKALAVEPAAQQGVDYYFTAQAQEGLQDWKGATDSLNQAAAHAGTNASLTAAVENEQAKVKKASGGGGL